MMTLNAKSATRKNTQVGSLQRNYYDSWIFGLISVWENAYLEITKILIPRISETTLVPSAQSAISIVRSVRINRVTVNNVPLSCTCSQIARMSIICGSLIIRSGRKAASSGAQDVGGTPNSMTPRITLTLSYRVTPVLTNANAVKVTPITVPPVTCLNSACIPGRWGNQVGMVLI
jgi:hypothetical protein